jgi:hypothetical protein
MSELYDRVVKALRETAHDEGHKWLMMHPSTWVEIENEIMPILPADVVRHVEDDGQIHPWGSTTIAKAETPGTWLLGVDIMLDLKVARGDLVIRIEKEF